MKPIGIVICNYNKCELVTQCIQSILESRVHNYDIYMVDNASTDNSVSAVKAQFPNEVTILENQENLGGSGGFNTGLRVVLEKGYEYFMCLDDDTMVDEEAIDALYQYMEKHPEVGMAGSRVYHMQMPDYIQQCGLTIDFKHCSASTLYADTLEDGTLPEVIECDTVATCAVMVRGSVIRETDAGIMPEDNYIYWDDMEWGYRIKQAGYKVVTLGSSKVLHQMGANIRRPNTFLNYYMWRNRTNFFMKYTPEPLLETMSLQLLGSIFDAMYESMLREEHNVMQTISYAFHDALAGVRGKAKDYEILKNDANDNRLTEYVRQNQTYNLITDGLEEDACYFRNFLKKINPALNEVENATQADITFHLCPYIFQVQDLSLSEIYIDPDRNCIISQDDALTVKNYNYCKSLFIYMNQGVMLQAARNIRRN